MNSTQVDNFGARLNSELGALDDRSRDALLQRIGAMRRRMLESGQSVPRWRGPVPEVSMLGAEVVVPTERGERRGRVICFGVVEGHADYERSVIVHVPASGTQHEAPGSLVRLAGNEDLERIRNEIKMADRLAEASLAARRGPKRPEEALARQRRRGLRDPALIDRMIAAAEAHPNVTAVTQGSSNFKVTGRDPSRRIYVFKTQLRVDVSGYDVVHPGVRPIDDEEARDMHLGKVRGQLLFDDREVAYSAFLAALDGLTSPAAAEV
jgi:hypothetical protein